MSLSIVLTVGIIQSRYIWERTCKNRNLLNYAGMGQLGTHAP